MGIAECLTRYFANTNKTYKLKKIESFYTKSLERTTRVTMSKTSRALPFLLSGILIAMIWAILWFLGLDDSLLLMAIFLPPFSALACGIIGVAYFGQEGFMREDRFHMMNLMLALALVVFAIAETATGVIGSSETGYLAIILMQLPGLLLVALGVTSYLRAVTEVLNYRNNKTIAGVIICIPFGFSAVAAAIIVIAIPGAMTVESLVNIIVTAGIGTLVLALGMLVSIFRQGELAAPLGLAFLAMLLYLTRSILWCCFGFTPLEPLFQILVVESYILLGSSISVARRLQDRKAEIVT